MKFSYNFLQSFFTKKLPPAEKLAELLMMHFFEVEEVKKVGTDKVLDIDILSSRAGDCLSHMGVAREISAITGIKREWPQVQIKEGKTEIDEKIGVDVRTACSRYMLSGVEGVTVKNSPTYIQKRLKSCGLKPINNIVDIVNYVMIETGQPLHAFDAEKIEGEKISVRYAKKREKIVTLDEKRLELNEGVLVIADEQSAIGVAGIKGGIVPEIDKNTKAIYLEAANFDPKVIRRGSRDTGIRTDASIRFEYGVPLELAQIATSRALSLILKTAGGRAMKGRIDYFPQEEKEKRIEISIEDVRSILGTEISLGEVEKILRSLEFKVQRDSSLFLVTVPFFRKDVERKEDLVEEIGRIYGYENITPLEPKESIVVSQERGGEKLEDICRNMWQGFGFSESYNYSFINEESALFYGRKKDLLEVEKPVSLEFKYLRPSLLYGLLNNLKENEKTFKEVMIFEIGKVFYKDNKEQSKEEKKIAAISSGDSFYDMKGKIEVFLKNISDGVIEYLPLNNENVFNNLRAAKVSVNGDVVGCFGEVSERARNKMKIKSKAVIADFDLEKLIELYKEVRIYEPIARFPSLIRDLSVLVSRETSYNDVASKIKAVGGKILKNLEIFDVYEGKEIGKDKKSFAFRLYFQDKGKTLSADAANKVQEKIINALEEVSEWIVRK